MYKRIINAPELDNKAGWTLSSIGSSFLHINVVWFCSKGSLLATSLLIQVFAPPVSSKDKISCLASFTYVCAFHKGWLLDPLIADTVSNITAESMVSQFAKAMGSLFSWLAAVAWPSAPSLFSFPDLCSASCHWQISGSALLCSYFPRLQTDLE